MRKLLFSAMFALFAMTMLSSCSKVPAGNVGIKFYLLGGDKGVDFEPLTPGRYWIGFNEELYLFPTFTQNYVWTAGEDEGSYNNEQFEFNDKDGAVITADMGITYYLEESKIPDIFQKYKRGVDEITDTFLKNLVRDELVDRTSAMNVSEIYGEGKVPLLDSVQAAVSRQVAPLGIHVEKLYWIGSIRPPATVIAAINNKIEATQKAQQRENELRETQAAANKKIAEADGEAASILKVAEAQAEANRKLASSLTPQIIEYEKVKKWNGVNSQVVGAGGGLMLNLK